MYSEGLTRLQLLLTLLVVLSGASFWFLFQEAIAEPEGSMPLLALLDLALYVALLGLSFILLPVWLPPLAVFLSTSPLLLLFLEDLTLGLAFVFGFSFMVLVPTFRARREAELRLEFLLFPILRKGIPIFLTIAALFLVASFYPQTKDLELEDVIPKHLLAENLKFGSYLGMNTGVDEKAIDILYLQIIQTLNERFEPYQRYLPVFFSIGAFIVFRTLFAVVGWIGLIISWVFFKLGLLSGALIIEKRPVNKEYIKLI
jgi:hypothetical protein